MNRNSEKGIAIILALIMLLVMSIMAISASFLSNIDFQGMSIFKRGQESFLATESCVVEARKRLETIGFAELENQITILNSYRAQGEGGLSASNNPFENTVLIDLDIDQARCRSGNRVVDQLPDLFFRKIGQRPIVRDLPNTSRASGGTSVTTVNQLSLTATGKDSQDEDIDDNNLQINTGVEVIYGMEVIVVGGSSNVQSGS